MPFDADVLDPTVFVPGREGLRRLAILLRQEMPEGFRWDFQSIKYKTSCGTSGCAMGLAMHLWPKETKNVVDRMFDHINSAAAAMAELFDIPPLAARKLFMACSIYGKPMYRITPVDVADAIDRYLDTGKLG